MHLSNSEWTPTPLSKSCFWAIKYNFKRNYSTHCLPPASALINECKCDQVNASLRSAPQPKLEEGYSTETSSKDRDTLPLIVGRRDRSSPLPSGVFLCFLSLWFCLTLCSFLVLQGDSKPNSSHHRKTVSTILLASVSMSSLGNTALMV